MFIYMYYDDMIPNKSTGICLYLSISTYIYYLYWIFFRHWDAASKRVSQA